MSEPSIEAAFLRSICEAPFDDGPRLIFADWLEENGDPGRAEFIRLGCAKGMPHPDPERAWNLWIPHRWEWCDSPGPLANSIGRRAAWDRGFVFDLICCADEFLASVEEVFRAAPITSVTLTDRESGNLRGKSGGHRVCGWLRQSVGIEQGTGMPLCSWIPDGIFNLLKPGNRDVRRYKSATAACLDLSRACVAYGRALVKLPPLTWPEGER